MARCIYMYANLLDGESALRRDVTVVTDGARIIQTDAGADVVCRPGDTCHDLRGLTLMPGMVTGHFHTAYSQTGPNPLPLNAPATQQALWAQGNAMTALRCGYTSLVGAGTFFDIDARLAEAIDAGIVPGPRLIPCSRSLSPEAVGGEGDDESLCLIASGAAAYRDATLREIERGAQIIKLFAAPGHAILGIRAMTPDEISAVVEVARAHGVRTRAHVAGRDETLLCAQLGVDIIDHADGMDDACIEAFLRHDCFVLPSLYMPYVIARDKGGAGAEWFDENDYVYMRDMLGRASAAGVKLVPGDDYGYGVLPHGTYSGELACYVEQCGLSPLDVIGWATRNGGALTGIADLGTLASGKTADMLVVDGDPSADITVLSQPDRIKAVIKGGEVVCGVCPGATPA